jgi:hypothetical protein
MAFGHLVTGNKKKIKGPNLRLTLFMLLFT